MDKKIIVALLAVIMLGMGAVTYWHMSSTEKILNSSPQPGREHRPTPATDAPASAADTAGSAASPATASPNGADGADSPDTGEQASGQSSAQSPESQKPAESALSGKPKLAPREGSSGQGSGGQGSGGQEPAEQAAKAGSAEQAAGGQKATAQPQPKTPEKAAEKPTVKQPEKATEKPAEKPVARAPITPKPESAPKTPEKAPASVPDNANPNGSLAIRDISLQFSGKGMVLRIVAESALTVKTFTLPSPDRLVVDVPGKWKNFSGPSIPSNNLVSGSRVGRNGNVDRLVLDLKTPLKKQSVVKINNTTYEVRFE